MIDVVYVFKHSCAQDLEILYSLRSVAANLRWVNKVWILGDRPTWLAEDTTLVQHVSHAELAWIGRWRLPVRNNFILTLLASLIPRLSQEFLWFADDYIILQPLTPVDLQVPRAIEDMKKVTTRGKGIWKESLWRTYSTLTRLGFPGLNFEFHGPQFYRREWIWEAFHDFRDFVSEDRFYGLLVHTAILNYVCKQYGHTPRYVPEEGKFIGVYPEYVVGFKANKIVAGQADNACEPERPGVAASSTEQRVSVSDLIHGAEGKFFLNFTDRSFRGPVEAYLAERFSQPCKYER